MKLTTAQQKVIEEAKRDIDAARSQTYPEWLLRHNSYYESHPEAYQKAIEREEMKNYYDDKRNAIVLTHCNSKTLEKLESLGLIEIQSISTGETFGIDTVKILNY